MTDTAVNRDPDACILKACIFEEANVYHVDKTGASVTADSSVSLIHRYCEKLPGDKYGYIFLVYCLTILTLIFLFILCFFLFS
jgi:hypothetical protein